MKNLRFAALYSFIILFALFCLTGCGSKQQIGLYVNGELTETVSVSPKAPLAAAEPVFPGYRFAGWFTDESGDAAYDAATEKRTELNLYAGFSSIFQGGLTFRPEPLTEEAVVPEFQEFGEIGRVEAVATAENGVLVRAVGNYGIHMEDSPTVTVGVRIAEDALVTGIWFLDSYAQTDGYPEKITADVLRDEYEGEYALPNMRVRPVTGASYTSEAVLYAVRTAANYVNQVYGIVSEETAHNLEEVNQVFQADYAPVPEAETAAYEKIGTILFAARGTGEKGENVLAMKVESAKSYNYDGAYRSPYDSSKPNSFIMIIVADLDSREIVAYRVIVDGTNCEFFMIPEEKYDAYLGSVISSPEAYDSFTDGLVQNYDGDWEFSVDDYNRKTITGTSIIYTGATVDGTFSSQMLRHCYRAAARYFCDYAG